MKNESKKRVVIIGAGPAGLTAGFELLKSSKFESVVLERDNIVGGLARTVDYKGYKFDIGPHHFITHSSKIEQWWKDLMGKDFLEHKRFTRIFYKKRFFNYPLEAINVIRGLNIFECVRCVLSYVWYRLFPIKNVKSFQDWVTNQFGYRLFSIFFKTYTEKVWGIPCDKISSDWASQRIKGFSMSKAIFYAFFGRWFKKGAPRTLSDEFYYPTHGAGMMWERVADKIEQSENGKVLLNQDVISIEHDGKKIVSVSAAARTSGASKIVQHKADCFLSTMPLKTLISIMDPAPPSSVIASALELAYRGLITVNFAVNKKNVIPDHWLYIHDKDVQMGRIGNMSNFSDFMTPDPAHSALSLEYFANLDSKLWKMSDQELLELGKKELGVLGLVRENEIVDGMVIKTGEAYPVYDEHYRSHLSCVTDYLTTFPNLKLMGRNGMHRYNNQDIAMLSAMEALADILEPDSLTMANIGVARVESPK